VCAHKTDVQDSTVVSTPVPNCGIIGYQSGSVSLDGADVTLTAGQFPN